MTGFVVHGHTHTYIYIYTLIINVYSIQKVRTIVHLNSHGKAAKHSILLVFKSLSMFMNVRGRSGPDLWNVFEIVCF